MSGTKDHDDGLDSRQLRPGLGGWWLNLATGLALVCSMISAAVIWLTLSRPVEVASAISDNDVWQLAGVMTRLLASMVTRLAAWL
jgi:hypothetical protein